MSCGADEHDESLNTAHVTAMLQPVIHCVGFPGTPVSQVDSGNVSGPMEYRPYKLKVTRCLCRQTAACNTCNNIGIQLASTVAYCIIKQIRSIYVLYVVMKMLALLHTCFSRATLCQPESGLWTFKLANCRGPLIELCYPRDICHEVWTLDGLINNDPMKSES